MATAQIEHHHHNLATTQPSTNNSSPVNLLTKTFWTALAPFDSLIGSFFTQPLADLLALKTFTHGTNFTNYLNIRCFGADPAKGASSNGSTKSFYALTSSSKDFSNLNTLAEIDNCKGYFFLFKDIGDISKKEIHYQQKNNLIQFKHGKLEEIEIDRQGARKYNGSGGEITQGGITQHVDKYECTITPHGREFINLLPMDFKGDNSIIGVRPDSSERYYVRSLLPMRHAIFSGIGDFAAPNETGKFATFKRGFGALVGACTPTISIRIAEGDPLLKELEVDPDFPSVALKTKRYISTKYMGLTGLLIQGCNRNVWQRMKKTPIRVCMGLIRLAALAGIVYLLYNRSTQFTMEA